MKQLLPIQGHVSYMCCTKKIHKTMRTFWEIAYENQYENKWLIKVYVSLSWIGIYLRIVKWYCCAQGHTLFA